MIAVAEVGVDAVCAAAAGDRVPAVAGVDEVLARPAVQAVDLATSAGPWACSRPRSRRPTVRRGSCRCRARRAARCDARRCSTYDAVAAGAVEAALVRLADARRVLVQPVARVGRVGAAERVVPGARVERAALVALVHQQHAVDARPPGVTRVRDADARTPTPRSAALRTAASSARRWAGDHRDARIRGELAHSSAAVRAR